MLFGEDGDDVFEVTFGSSNSASDHGIDVFDGANGNDEFYLNHSSTITVNGGDGVDYVEFLGLSSDTLIDLSDSSISFLRNGLTTTLNNIEGIGLAVRCLIPWFDGVIYSLEWKEALWDRYVMGAPRPRTQSEQQYSDRKLRTRR